MRVSKSRTLGGLLIVFFLQQGAAGDYEYNDDEDLWYTGHGSGSGAGGGDETKAQVPLSSPRFLSEPSDIQATVGGSVTFPCDAENLDNVSTLWINGKKEVIFGNSNRFVKDERFQLVDGTSLQISDLLPTDSGDYICQIVTDPVLELIHNLRVTSRPSHEKPCPNKSEKWIDLGGDYCYLIERDDTLWIDAVYQCFVQGGSLVSLHSSEETKRLQHYFKNEYGRLHIGLWKHNDGSLEWIDDVSSDYRNWNYGKPSSNSKQCVEMYMQTGKWNDIQCTDHLGYVCSSLKTAQPAPGTKKVCPASSPKWSDYGGDRCYIIELYEEMTWTEASEICSAAGGSLVSFHSVEEVSLVREQIKLHHDRIHIGFRQNGDEIYEWEDRSPVDLEFWATGEPNDVSGEKCCEMYPGSGRWNDIPCDKREGYICSTLKVDPGISVEEPAPPSEPEVCGEDIVSENGTIQSPNYPENYNPNGNCVWKITVPENYQVALNFEVVNLEYGADCEYDYIEVFDGHETDSAPLAKLCGSDSPQIQQSSANKMTVKFVSDFVNQKTGFLAKFSKVNKCGGSISSEKGVIQSRNYPDNYWANDVCIWKITVPENYGIGLKFRAFEVEDGGYCMRDYVEILDGHDETSFSLGRFCGTYLPSEINSSGHKITVKFVSDGSKEYYGFSAEFDKDEPVSVAEPTTQPEVKVCGENIVSEKGVLLSPNYPSRYVGDDDCTWSITVPAGYHINLRFKTFQLESGSECNYDYVQVFDGYDTNQPSLGKLCGSAIPDTISSSGNEMVVKFKSDSSVSLTGFAATFNISKSETLEPEAELQPSEGCGGNIKSEGGVIQSPSYPSNYGPNERCTWNIMVPVNNQVVLKFSEFNLEQHIDCKYDYVVIRDGLSIGSRILAKFCGHGIPAEVRSSGHKLMVEFGSDSTGEYTGFSAEFVKELMVQPSNIPLPETGACGGNIQSENGTISTPNYPENYEPLRECTWKITVPENHVVFLRFPEIAMEQPHEGECKFDFVKIIDGHDTESHVLDTLCGEHHTRHYVSTTNKMVVKFVSDDTVESPGFTASFRKGVRCGERIVADKGVLQTPDNTNGWGFLCEWSIVVPQNYTVLLKLQQPKRSAGSQGHYTVQIRDGPNVTSPYLADFPDYALPANVRSNGNIMYVSVTSDDMEGAPGFYAEFVKDTCGGDITADSGFISSTNFPESYNPNEICQWKITVAEGYQVSLKFTSFQLEDGSCNYDYVEIFDGVQSNWRLGKYCGSGMPPAIISQSNTINVRFVSDGSDQRMGFSAEFKKDRCGGDINADAGALSSPNYPSNYQPNSVCIWKISVPEDQQVFLQFQSFNLEFSSSCNFDYVEVLDGHDDDSQVLGHFCGDTVPSSLRSSANTMTVKFVSDSSAEREGFTAEFQGERTSYPDIESLLRQLPGKFHEKKQRIPQKKSSSGKMMQLNKKALLQSLQAALKKR